uniref:Uncharacterized protein n=1 Tax=Spongospora subterranea TaxID=70186 RepID=A0A0H5RD09_9EUKA|eukprot:CRZ11641.1 hypothetical protein [Spongospora subterranea]
MAAMLMMMSTIGSAQDETNPIMAFGQSIQAGMTSIGSSFVEAARLNSEAIHPYRHLAILTAVKTIVQESAQKNLRVIKSSLDEAMSVNCALLEFFKKGLK